MTLLDMTQDILSDMNSDEVNSITDTAESLQVAQIIKSSFYNIVDGKDFPWLKELFQLSTSGTVSKPTHMKLPETIIDLDWIKYNAKKPTETRNRYEVVKYKTPEDFLALIDVRDSTASNVQVVTDSTGIKLSIINNTAPTYFTSFDDETLVFDSFNS